jgi:hypothetical protein
MDRVDFVNLAARVRQNNRAGEAFPVSGSIIW